MRVYDAPHGKVPRCLISLLSALALLALTALVPIVTGDHATVVGLEELSCFIQRVSNLLLLVFLLLNDCIESLTSAFLLHTLFILIFDLLKLLLLLFKVGLSLVTLLVPFTHLLII